MFSFVGLLKSLVAAEPKKVHWKMSNAPPLPAALDRRAYPRRLCRKDATGRALAYVYARDTKSQADSAKVLTMDEMRRIASNIDATANRFALKST